MPNHQRSIPKEEPKKIYHVYKKNRKFSYQLQPGKIFRCNSALETCSLRKADSLTSQSNKDWLQKGNSIIKPLNYFIHTESFHKLTIEDAKKSYMTLSQ